MSAILFKRQWAIDRFLCVAALLLLAAATMCSATAFGANEPPLAHSEELFGLNKSAPVDVVDLEAIQAQVLKIVDHIRDSTVAIIVGDSQGSGVIVSEDGLVLTAAHVVGSPGRKLTLVLPSGRRVAGRALGANAAGDCAIVQITDHGPFAASKISDSRNLHVGDWCLATGHPGGYQAGRPAVVRLGRVVAIREGFLQTDCPLLGGDSGGPLFDLAGNVIGIHSRIGPRTTLNLHVAASVAVRDWKRLTRAPEPTEGGAGSQGMLGVDGRDDPRGALVTAVYPRLPAADALLQIGDIVTTFAGRPVHGMADLIQHVQARHAGEAVELGVIRGDSVFAVRVTLVARPAE